MSQFSIDVWIRTNDNRITNRVLWPTELKRQLYRVCRRTRTDDHLNHNQGLWPTELYTPCKNLVQYRGIEPRLQEWKSCVLTVRRILHLLRQLDSNQRSRKTAVLQTAAIATMRCLNLSIDDRTRTCDLSIPNAAFYRLNYIYVGDSWWIRTIDPEIKSFVLCQLS